jgi:hypothetical protein
MFVEKGQFDIIKGFNPTRLELKQLFTIYMKELIYSEFYLHITLKPKYAIDFVLISERLMLIRDVLGDFDSEAIWKEKFGECIDEFGGIIFSNFLDDPKNLYAAKRILDKVEKKYLNEKKIHN